MLLFQIIRSAKHVDLQTLALRVLLTPDNLEYTATGPCLEPHNANFLLHGKQDKRKRRCVSSIKRLSEI